MMRALFTLFTLILLTACQSSKLAIDYDTETDFSTLHRYAWLDKTSGTEEGIDPLMAQRVKSAVSRQLQAAGLRTAEFPRDAEVLVRYYVGSHTEVQEPKSRGSIGIGSGGGHTALGISLSLPLGGSTTFKNVEILVDLLDAATKKLIWRGTYRLQIGDETPQEITTLVNQAVSEIFKRYPPPAAKMPGATSD